MERAAGATSAPEVRLATPSPRSVRRPQPADLRFRRSLGWQRLRWASLALSWLTLVGLPLLHLAAAHLASAGRTGGALGEALASALGPALPLLAGTGAGPAPLAGSPGAIVILGLELVDPLASVSVLLAAGSVPLVAALPALLLVIPLGRFFCGWVCPYVTLLAVSNGLRSLLAKLGLPPKDLALPRRTAFVVLAALLAATAIAGAPVALAVYPPALVGREVFHGLFLGGVGGGAAVLLAIFLFDTFVSRAGFCRTLCPGGALYTALAVRSPLRIVRTPEACTDCTACDVVCNLGQLPMTDRLDAGCERCGKCVSVCPTGALELKVVRP